MSRVIFTIDGKVVGIDYVHPWAYSMKIPAKWGKHSIKVTAIDLNGNRTSLVKTIY